VWGGRWPDAGPGDATPAAATKLAYAPRGGATLASFLPNGVPELAVLGAVPAPVPTLTPPSTPATDAAADGGAGETKPRASRCGCDVIGSAGEGHAAGGALFVLALLLRRVASRRGVRRGDCPTST
jgi:hypothetical protein